MFSREKEKNQIIWYFFVFDLNEQYGHYSLGSKLLDVLTFQIYIHIEKLK